MSDTEQGATHEPAPTTVAPGEPEPAFRLGSLSEEPPPVGEAPPVEPASFPELGPDLTLAGPDGGVARAAAQALDLRLLSGIPLEVTVELGRAVLTVSDLLALRPGSVVELAGGASTVDVVVNGHLVARGDVVVVEDSFGVRVTEIVEP